MHDELLELHCISANASLILMGAEEEIVAEILHFCQALSYTMNSPSSGQITDSSSMLFGAIQIVENYNDLVGAEWQATVVSALELRSRAENGVVAQWVELLP